MNVDALVSLLQVRPSAARPARPSMSSGSEEVESRQRRALEQVRLRANTMAKRRPILPAVPLTVLSLQGTSTIHKYTILI